MRDMLWYLQCVHGVIEVGDLELARLPLSFREARPDGVLQNGVIAVQKYLTLSGARARSGAPSTKCIYILIEHRAESKENRSQTIS